MRGSSLLHMYPPTFQPQTQRPPLGSQTKGQHLQDLIRSPAPVQDPRQPLKENFGAQLQVETRSYYRQLPVLSHHRTS